MTISASYGAYPDCYSAMDEALADDQGIRVKVKDHDAALFFRMRLHQARKIDRNRNNQVYEPGDPQYGASVYDPLVVRIRRHGPDVYVYIQQVTASLGKIEALSQLGDWNAAPMLEAVAEQPAIEAQPAPLMIEHFKRRV